MKIKCKFIYCNCNKPQHIFTNAAFKCRVDAPVVATVPVVVIFIIIYF